MVLYGGETEYIASYNNIGNLSSCLLTICAHVHVCVYLGDSSKRLNYYKLSNTFCVAENDNNYIYLSIMTQLFNSMAAPVQ